jgi:hypothetical protein
MHTQIVPTPDSLIDNNKSILWCAAFNLAWNRLRDDLAREPILLPNAQDLADRLNRSPALAEDAERFHLLAVTGLGRDAIVPRIHMQLANQFPRVPPPELTVPLNGMLAYAYLNISVPFPHPYLPNDKPLNFTDSAGNTTPVKSFGLPVKAQPSDNLARSQTEVLYRSPAALPEGESVPEFILDLCEGSKPYQLLVAKLPRGATLADTIADVEAKIAQGADTARKLAPAEVLLVPSLAFRIQHHFQELEGKDKQFNNRRLKGTFLHQAIQSIDFRLERGGADPDSAVPSDAIKDALPLDDKTPRARYELDRPFLILLKKRGADRPFFALWIDNAELLENW